MTSAMAKAGARIERPINKLLNSQVMDWESRIAQQHVRRGPSAVSIATGALLLFFVALFIIFAFEASAY